MVGLHADAQHSRLAHRIAAARHVADLCGGHHEVLVAHDFGRGRRHFGKDGPLELLKIGAAGGIVEDVFAEFAYREALNGLEGFLPEAVEDEAAYVVLIGVDLRLPEDFAKGQIG
jgi:hypothetical protein